MLKEFYVEKPDPDELDDFMDHFDPHTYYFRTHYYNIMERMVRTRPVLYSEVYDGGFYVVSGFKLLRSAANDGTHFSSASDAIMLPRVQLPELIPGGTNGPDHSFYRQILNPLFSPSRMSGHIDAIRALARKLVGSGLQEKSFDIVRDLARPLTGVTTMHLLGLGEDEWQDYEGPVHNLHFSKGTIEQRNRDFVGYEQRIAAAIRGLIQRSDARGAIGALMRSDHRQRRLSEAELCQIVSSLIFGGLGTTQAVMGSASVYLGRNPDKRQELIDHPERIPNAVNELIRMFPASNFVGRVIMEDIELANVKMSAGRVAHMFWASANFDPDFVNDPFTVDFNRDVNRLSSFGLGPHMCLGQHLARVELQVCFEVLLELCPNYQLIEEQLGIPDGIGAAINISSVPVALRPGSVWTA